MTYDQWKTTDPADFYAPVCECCGGYLRGLGRGECDACADEFLAEEAFMAFYQWEPEGVAAERDGYAASLASGVNPNSPDQRATD